MQLAVVSHKICWRSEGSPTGYVTDGGFPLQMEAISELFSSTEIAVPCDACESAGGASPLKGRSVTVTPLSVPRGKGIRRKIDMFRWALVNGPAIWRSVRNSDAVHSPIPGDVGTIGMVFALILRKPLFVRHCGNWLAPKTTAEKIWKWSMERLAGGRNVMMATGGADEPPSARNPAVKWIFSTSLRRGQIENNAPLTLPEGGKLRLVVACRLEEKKGTDVVISALPAIRAAFPEVELEVVGGGSLLDTLKEQAKELGVADRVTFRGKVEQSEVVRLMKRAHLFCYPTSASEGFPKVVLEALASGLPVITTEVSVLPNLIGPDCGVILDEPSPAALYEAVVRVCSDPGKYSLMSAKAVETAGEYSLERWRDYIGRSLRESWRVEDLAEVKGLGRGKIYT
ncbi:MAG: glycosyltransferase [Acidobacteriota bacterium]|nr:MAG: glycosyltransferase [Acidobacteriota bacterium]